jgi:hypothetical protein
MRITNEKFAMLRRKSSSSSMKRQQEPANAPVVANTRNFSNAAVVDDFVGADVSTYHPSGNNRPRTATSNFYVGQPREYRSLYQQQVPPLVERITFF